MNLQMAFILTRMEFFRESSAVPVVQPKGRTPSSALRDIDLFAGPHTGGLVRRVPISTRQKLAREHIDFPATNFPLTHFGTV
jgi:hypothetical protein